MGARPLVIEIQRPPPQGRDPRESCDSRARAVLRLLLDTLSLLRCSGAGRDPRESCDSRARAVLWLLLDTLSLLRCSGAGRRRC